ncbi:MAG: GNAT family N-acetyltransferase [Bacilli bacterium]|jgi:GNAT superfamily N-acetyltransferase|nr:GNAT family N-acetyltransferase [Bacilli bacterium]
MAELEFREIPLTDLASALTIISQAKRLLAKQSNQWQNGYPNEETLRTDIAQHSLYGSYDGKELLALMALKPGIDPAYQVVEDGSWTYPLSNKDLVIHRLAVREDRHGQRLGYRMVAFAKDYADKHGFLVIRIDTHIANKAMQTVIQESGFGYAGIVYLPGYTTKEDSRRLGFEWPVAASD